MRPHLVANLVYSWMLDHIDPNKVEEWHRELAELLPWQSGESEAAIALESEAFLKMAANAKGG